MAYASEFDGAHGRKHGFDRGFSTRFNHSIAVLGHFIATLRQTIALQKHCAVCNIILVIMLHIAVIFSHRIHFFEHDK